MSESWETRVKRWGFNWFPCYRATGARIQYIASDWQEIRLRLPLNRRTRNYVGTIFGGSMYGAVDPIHMVMLIKLLGRGYEIWDKAANFRFRQPGRSTLYANVRIGSEELEAIRNEVARDGKIERQFTVELTDEAGQVCFSCEKLISIKKKS